MSRHVDTTTGRRRVMVTPERDDLVDAGLLLVLMLLALIGFRTTFSGWTYLVAGLTGTVLGLVIAHLANVLRQPMIAVAAMTLAVFFLAGGAIALRSTAIAGLLPSGSTLHGLANESVHGWKDLLTTLPPVDGGGPLIVLPYLLGLLGGVGGFCLARRVRGSAAPVAEPLAVLVTVILLGTQTPAARLLQGALFGAVALGWVALRAQRRRAAARTGSGRLVRWATAAVLLALAFGGAAVLGPHVPGAESHKRTVLRSYVEPPFDVGQYPSPLAGFRKYTKPAPRTLFRTTLFTAHGLPAGTLVRIATMDDYNDLTWTAANQTSGPVPDTFQRVGTEIDNPARGRVASFSVTIGAGYTDVWLPDAGALTRLAFTGRRAGSHASYFRYDLATGTGVVPDRLEPGDTYTARTVLPRTTELRASDPVAVGATLADTAAFLKTQAGNWSGRTESPTARILGLAAHLHDLGRFSDGEPPNQQYLPGHSQARLLAFVNGAQVVGDDEQYAAAYALMINELGTPARVVLGAQLASSGRVTGADVHAWVEVQLVDGTWRAVLPDTFMNRNRPPDKQPPQEQQKQSGKIVPPPARTRPRSSLADASEADSRSHNDPRRHKAAVSSGFHLPGWVSTVGRWAGPPLLLLAIACALITGAKAWRRHRRRTRGHPASRLAKGWAEVVDLARDLGTVMPGGRTRREQAALLAAHDVGSLAHSADAHVFGPQPPGDPEVVAFWAQVDETRRRMSRSVGWRRRLWAALNLASLRSPHGAAGGSS